MATLSFAVTRVPVPMAITSFLFVYESRPIAILFARTFTSAAAVLLSSTFALEPMAIEFSPNVYALEPSATASPPFAKADLPIATSWSRFAVALVPIATVLVPLHLPFQVVALSFASAFAVAPSPIAIPLVAALVADLPKATEFLPEPAALLPIATVFSASTLALEPIAIASFFVTSA